MAARQGDIYGVLEAQIGEMGNGLRLAIDECEYRGDKCGDANRSSGDQ